ncbi:hypothetical protein BDV95DRAFT_622577 [Massariosphaeria phaeospora]|uniref:Uncharacterized protein n=1 Tax=Massariosphaeria phaeospora TaxID=100035 RepID=A0A7C8I4I4_9PLEO|nr:hypothetical protein BDV95DRAFT_622577 [Massariosphaeria phaeospora]
MKLTLVITLLHSSLSLANILEARQACYKDDCLRAINGTRRGPSHPATGTSNCMSFLTSTVLVAPVFTTTTVTARATLTEALPCTTSDVGSSNAVVLPTLAPKLAKARQVKPRQESSTSYETTSGTIPFYATSACPTERYSSACSCLGVTPGLVTSTSVTLIRTVTTTITSRPVASCTTVSPSASDPPTTVSDPVTSVPTTLTNPATSSPTTPVPSIPTTLTNATTSIPTTLTNATTSIPTTSLVDVTTSILNGTTSAPPSIETTSTYSVTLTLNSTVSTSIITLTSGTDISETGTSYITTEQPTSSAPSATPPYGNGTTTTSGPVGTAITTSSSIGTAVTTSSSSDSPAFGNGTTTISSSSIGTAVTTSSSSESPAFGNGTTTISSSSIGTSVTNSLDTTTTPGPTDTSTISESATPTPTPTPTDPVCSPTPFAQPCNGTCTDLRSDIANCGACGNQCSGGHLCTNGVCVRQSCDSRCGLVRSCGPSGSSCICGQEAGGGGVCFESRGSCSQFDNCIDTEDCDLGFVCVLENCCGSGKCVNTAGCGDTGSALGRMKPVDLGVLGEGTIFGGFSS